VATEAQDTKRDDRVRVVRDALELINKRLTNDVALPLDATMRVKSIIVQDCTHRVCACVYASLSNVSPHRSITRLENNAIVAGV
jgi:hypothetical protein